MRKKPPQLNARITPDQARELGQAIDRWRRTRGLTQAQMLPTARVSQGQLSRILAGRFSRTTPAVRRLCQTAGVDVTPYLAATPSSGRWRSVLERTLHRSWDGSPRHARALIRLLQAANALRSP